MAKFSKPEVKIARFYCESCGEEVSRDAKKCIKCGKSFLSVRCASCDFVGEEDLFMDGCPVCGYKSDDQPGNNEKNHKKNQKKYILRKEAAGKLAPWVYFLTIAVFTAIIAALFIYLS